MMRFLMPIVLIGITGSLFFMFTNPLYNDISLSKEKVASYDEALFNSNMLEKERDKLTSKLNEIDPNNLARLQKLLPENVDNIRLILEIEKIAAPYGMTLKEVKYSTINTTAPLPATATIQGAGGAEAEVKDYGIFDLEFSTTGSYDNFISFTKNLENNLRIVDISSIVFSSDANANVASDKTASSGEVYKYNFKIKTYWLKN